MNFSLMNALVTAPGNTAIVTKIPVPQPGPREIRVKVHSVALNPVDALYVAHPSDAPGRVVGSDISGIIDMTGDSVTAWEVGDRVAGLLQGATSGNQRPGGFAEYAILEADLAIKIPDGVSFEDAATLPLCSLTAAQALFIRLEIPAPFPSNFSFPPPQSSSPAILVYSASTSVGQFVIHLARLLRTQSGNSYRVFATASGKHHEKLLAFGVDAVYDYHSPTWPEDVRQASSGIDFAVDCISEDDSTAKVSQTFGERGGKIAVVRSTAWSKEGIREDVTPLYGAAWMGLGREIIYNVLILDGVIPASLSWRAFTVHFFRFLSSGSPQDPSKFPVEPNPVRLEPGGLERIVEDGFTLLGSGR
ncbi:chaperonin 10-like protein [Cyathus striatus]|nr:chaperonin 10-like protein [Cyathus striatus]